MNERWHKGSRFYLVGLQALWLSWAVIPVTLYFWPAAVEEAIGVFGLVSFTLLGGGAASNFQQARTQVRDAQGGAS